MTIPTTSKELTEERIGELRKWVDGSLRPTQDTTDLLFIIDEYEKTRAGEYKLRPEVGAFAAILESMLRDHEGAIGQPEGTDDAGWLIERLRDEALKLVEYATKGMLSEDTPSPGLSDADEHKLGQIVTLMVPGVPDWKKTFELRDYFRSRLSTPALRGPSIAGELIDREWDEDDKPAPPATEPIQIVFDGPPAPESGRFVEVEQGGRGVNFGEWKRREDGYWVLELPIAPPAAPVRVSRERVKNWIPCQCIDDYKDRGIDDPTCPYHSTACGWEDLLEELGVIVDGDGGTK